MPCGVLLEPVGEKKKQTFAGMPCWRPILRPFITTRACCSGSSCQWFKHLHTLPDLPSVTPVCCPVLPRYAHPTVCADDTSSAALEPSCVALRSTFSAQKSAARRSPAAPRRYRDGISSFPRTQAAARLARRRVRAAVTADVWRRVTRRDLVANVPPARRQPIHLALPKTNLFSVRIDTPDACVLVPSPDPSSIDGRQTRPLSSTWRCMLPR